MVSGSADGRKGGGIENEEERGRERGMGMAHLAAAGPTSDSIPTRSSSACLTERETPLLVRSQMAAAAVYNNVLLIGPK